MPDLPRDVAFARRAAYLRDADALVLADVHLGRAADSAVEFPLGERSDVRERLGALLERFDPGAVVVAGDLLHPFDGVPPAARESLDAVAGDVADAGAELLVTPGNHDGALAEALDAPTPAEHRLDDGTVVCHGHEAPDADADRYVVGHDHPAMDVEGSRHPCFLYGPGGFRGGDLLVLPAFSRLAPGTPVNGMRAGDPLSPVVSEAVSELAPVVYDDDAEEPLAFPPLPDLREHL